MPIFNKLLISITFLVFSGMAQAQAQTQEIPITTCSELQFINVMNGQYYLDADIDCNGLTFHPIDGDFSGTLDGRGHIIANLSISNALNEEKHDTGLFRSLIPASKITNLHFENARVTAWDNVNRGLIAGQAYGSEISNITVEGVVIRDDVDYKNDLGVSGGLVGIATDTYFLNVHLYGDVKVYKNGFGGGIAGIAVNGTVIEKSSVKALAGVEHQCDNTASECGFGGLVGLIGPFEPDEYPRMTNNEYDVVITESSASGIIEVNKNLGGLVGFIKPGQLVHIKDSYAIVELCWNQNSCKYAGGLIGKAQEGSHQENIILENVYAAGKVKPGSEYHSRAIVGHDGKQGSTRVTLQEGAQSYFDIEATEKQNSGDKVSEGLSTAQMQATPETDGFKFSSWNPDVWSFSTASETQYPTLKSAYIPPAE